MSEICKYLSFISVVVLIAAMSAATVLERAGGTEDASRFVYHSPWFMALWAAASVSGLVWLVRRKVYKQFFTFSLHLSFVLILSGALLTFITGKKGRVYMRVGETVSAFADEGGLEHKIPFGLRLDRFAVKYYPGTESPEDYSSTVSVLPEGGSHVVSMNNILKYKGYRFYQADFDQDGGGSTLAVSYDPWGIGVTYSGYLLLFVSMAVFFFQKASRYRAVLARVAASLVMFFGFLASPSAEARKLPGSTPKVLPEKVASAFGDLMVYYNGRICPLSTLTREYCLKAYGKAGWNDFTSEQTVTGWLFYYDWWRVVPFTVKDKDRGTSREAEKEYLMRSVASGDALRIFPVRDADGAVRWYSCNDELPASVLDNYDLWVFVRKVLDVVDVAVRSGNWDEALAIVVKIGDYQEKVAGDVLPSQAKVKAERLWSAICRPVVPFMLFISLGIILFVFYGILISRRRNFPRLPGYICAFLTLMLWMYLTVAIGLRWYVSGHGPFAGSYNVMMLMAWLTSAGILACYRRFPLVLPLGFILAGFAMLQASLSGANPQITHLMPVLQSPLLSVHVMSMMISYTLFGLIALNGIMGLCVKGTDESTKLMDISLVVLYPALFLLAFGTFLGAVWANISWGGYWTWDPKETWALVTLLIYAFPLHGGSIRCFSRQRLFHIYSILAFSSVLITYFGVNLILGGMHAYA